MILTIWPVVKPMSNLPMGCLPLSRSFLLIKVLVFVLNPLERRNSQFSVRRKSRAQRFRIYVRDIPLAHGRELREILLHTIWRAFHTAPRRTQSHTPWLCDNIQNSRQLLQTCRSGSRSRPAGIDRGPGGIY